MTKGGEMSIAAGLKWIALGKLSTQLITWGMTFFVLRLLDPSDYGVVALSSAITLLFGLIAEFGLSSAIVQAKSTNQEQLASIFGYGIVLNFCIVAVLQILAPYVIHLYSDERLPTVIRVASLQFLFTALSLLPDAEMQRKMKYKLIAKLEFLFGVFAGVCTLVMAYLGYGYWSLVISPLLAAFFRMVLLNITAQQWVRPSLSLNQTRELLAFGGITLLARMAGHFLSQADVLIAGFFLTKEALGIYSVAMQLATMPLSKIMSVINQVAYPELSRMNREDGVKSEILLHGGRMVSYVLFPALWGLSVVAPFVVHLLMGDKWEAAILPLQIVCLALPLRAISALLSTALSAVGRVDYVFWNTVIGCIILPISFYLGAQHGVIGIAWAWLIGTPIFVLATIVHAGSILGISVPLVMTALRVPFLCGAMMYVAIFLSLHFGMFQPDRADHLFYSIVMGAALYGFLLWRFDAASFKVFVGFIKLRYPTS